MREENSLPCADCETPIDVNAPHYCNSDGYPVCDDCRDDYCDCHDCGETVRKDGGYADVNGAGNAADAASP
ncbi:MAG: hypothetical protein LBT97_02365 [Planctomycetota bacterium]|jgi:hypothetical protein|nr:hypothetical protein [Planctomycetota bacterium]